MLIERYVTTEILKPFAAGLAMLATVFIAFTAAIKLSDAASGEIPPGTVTQLILLSTLIALEVLVPTTLYLAALFAIGRMHRDSEMAAIAAAGIGEGRIVWAVLRLGIVIAALVALLSLVGRPWAYARSYALEQQALSRLDVSNIRAGSFVDLGLGGYVLYAHEVDPDANELLDVFVHVERETYTEVISAKRARVHGPDAEGSRAVEFYDGHTYLLDPDGERDVNMRFNSFQVRFPEEERMLTFRRKAVATGTLGESDDPKDIAEYQWRLTTPLATVLLAALAVPLARARPRQSRFAVFVVALLAYLMLFTATGMVRNALENGDLPPYPGLVFAYVPFFGLLLLLLWMPRLSHHRWHR